MRDYLPSKKESVQKLVGGAISVAGGGALTWFWTHVIAAQWDPAFKMWGALAIMLVTVVGWTIFVAYLFRERPKPAAPFVTVPQVITHADVENEAALQFRRHVEALQLESREWQFKCFNLAFFEVTQQLLDWLYLRGSCGVSAFDTHWSANGLPTSQIRQETLEVLGGHRLVSLANGVLEITGKGREYVEWRGAIDYEAQRNRVRSQVIANYEHMKLNKLIPKKKRATKPTTPEDPSV